MRKFVIASVAAATVGLAWAEGPGQEQYQQQFRDQPQARAYLSYNFGGDNRRRGLAAPLHYGLRLDYDSRLRQGSSVVTTPLLQLDHDNRGESMAFANGVPFAARNLRLNEDAGSGASTGSSSGWSYFDWGLLAVGIGGTGYLIYDATKGHNSPDAKPTSGSTTGTTTGVVNTVTGVVTGVVNTVTGVVNTVTGVVTGVVNAVTGYAGPRTVEGVLPFDPVDRTDPQYQKWLDGGTGQMGDLGG